MFDYVKEHYQIKEVAHTYIFSNFNYSIYQSYETETLVTNLQEKFSLMCKKESASASMHVPQIVLKYLINLVDKKQYNFFNLFMVKGALPEE